MKNKEKMHLFDQQIGRAQVRGKRLADMIKACDKQIKESRQLITQMSLLKSQATDYLADFHSLGGEQEPEYQWTLYDFPKAKND